MTKPEFGEVLREEFNRWAEAGRGEGMEQEHLPITLPVLGKMHLASADNVLDVGCGAGWLSRRLAKSVPQGRVVGMDVSDEMIRRARRASVDFENLMFVTGEVGEIPWEPNFFSHVISVESSYYWPDPAAGIHELFRLRRGHRKRGPLIPADTHFSFNRQGLDRPPRLQATPSGYILVYDLSCG